VFSFVPRGAVAIPSPMGHRFAADDARPRVSSKAERDARRKRAMTGDGQRMLAKPRGSP